MKDENLISDSHSAPRSPAVEHATKEQFQETIRELLESRGMYQNCTIRESYLEEFADAEYTVDCLSAEFRRRPIEPCSRGEGDGVQHAARAVFGGKTRTGAVTRTPSDERVLSFDLPNIQAACPCCEGDRTFLSMSCSGPALESPYPILGENTEQAFHLYYRCGSCRNAFLVFQIHRRGLKLQLTGRSIPYRQKLDPVWPKEIRAIVQDANSAAGENDLAAAYYHLRTAIEFLMKGALDIDPKQKKDGKELCDEYGEKLDRRVKEGFPSLGPIYSKLSDGLHSRDVSPEVYNELFNNILDHLKAKDLVSRYSQGAEQTGHTESC